MEAVASRTCVVECLVNRIADTGPHAHNSSSEDDADDDGALRDRLAAKQQNNRMRLFLKHYNLTRSNAYWKEDVSPPNKILVLTMPTTKYIRFNQDYEAVFVSIIALFSLFVLAPSLVVL